MQNESAAERDCLLLGSIEKVEMRWVYARSMGAEHPAVLVIDPEDPHGRAILATSGQETQIQSVVDDATRRGMAPVMTWGLPKELAQALVRAAFGGTDSIVDADTGDGYYAIVVAAGGASVYLMPPVPA